MAKYRWLYSDHTVSYHDYQPTTDDYQQAREADNSIIAVKEVQQAKDKNQEQQTK